MVKLSRRPGERIRFRTAAGEHIWIVITSIERGKAVMGIEAPRSVEILREELLPIQEQFEV